MSVSTQNEMNPLPAVAAVALLLLCLGQWPYAFYTLMRFVVCGASAYMALESNRQHRAGWMWLLGAVALLFNPIFPVHMSRTDWRYFDLGAAVVLAAALAVLRRRS